MREASTIVKPKCHGSRIEGLEPGRALAGCWRCRTATWRPQSGPIARRPPALPEGRVWAIVGSACSSPHTVASFPRGPATWQAADLDEPLSHAARCAVWQKIRGLSFFVFRAGALEPITGSVRTPWAQWPASNDRMGSPMSTSRQLTHTASCCFSVWRRSEQLSCLEFRFMPLKTKRGLTGNTHAMRRSEG